MVRGIASEIVGNIIWAEINNLTLGACHAKNVAKTAKLSLTEESELFQSPRCLCLLSLLLVLFSRSPRQASFSWAM